jgi:hypothetical protein
MSTNKPFAAWNTPTQRAHRAQAPAAIAPPKRRPFSTPKTAMQPSADSTLKTAQIFLFTGSNTPYQSHE